MSGPTPGPWFVGCQNDALFVIAGRPPALNNDHPWHDAPRVALAKVYGPSQDDCLPVNADANARLIAAAPDLLEALKELCSAISKARDLVPDDEEGLAASIFCYHLNTAQAKAERVIWTAIGKEGE